jgi:hypothetical protein
MDERTHRMNARVFVNGNGDRAIRIPDVQLAECVYAACGCVFYVESPVDAVHCSRCGRQGVRIGADWAKPEAFLMQEPRGAINQIASLRGDNEDSEPRGGSDG